jgi:hypothetical protein
MNRRESRCVIKTAEILKEKSNQDEISGSHSGIKIAVF